MTAPNPMRGEAEFGEHRLVVDFNGFCALEAAMNKKVPEILALMDAGLGFTDLRTCVRVFLDAEMTDEEAGELLGSVGYAEALKAVSAACSGFFAPAKKEKADRPLKAA